MDILRYRNKSRECQPLIDVPKTSAGQRGIEEAVVALRVLDSKAPVLRPHAWLPFLLSAFPDYLIVFLLSRFNRATLSKTGSLRQRTDATCPEQLTGLSLPMRPFLDLGVRHPVKYVYRSKSFSQSIAFGLAFHSLIYQERSDGIS